MNQNITKMGMLDMHAHLSFSRQEDEKELHYRQSQGILTCFSAGTPKEWEYEKDLIARMEQAFGEEMFRLSFGIHPWYADAWNPSDWMELYRQSPVIGEIGMDSVWCQVPPDIQKKRFLQQLQIAADLHRPVVLHTKGQERLIAEIIRDFPEKCLIHWYSGDARTLEQYLKMDCYFTVGPDSALICAGEGMIGDDGEHRTRCILMREAPLDRVFTETDGLSAVAWAFGQTSLSVENVKEVLWKNTLFLAAGRGILPEQLIQSMYENWNTFLDKNN